MNCEIPRRILLATDLGPASVSAVRFAGHLARSLDAKLTLFHAVAPMVFFDFGAWDSASLAVAAAGQLERAALELRKLRNDELDSSIDVEIETREAGPAHGILEIASAKHSDLIILGSHAWGPITSFFLGSVTQGVLHQSDIPVITVRPQSSEPRLGTILCPVDFSELSHATMLYADRLAAATGAALELIHLVEPGSEAAPGSIDEWLPETVRARDVRTITNRGHAAEEVVRHARDRGVDLIIVGARHRRFVDTTVLGTTTERIIRHATCPVMAVTMKAVMESIDERSGVA